MALIEKLKNIANAIRSKTNKSEGLTLEQMASEVGNIYSPKAEEVREVTIENNGLNTITPSDGFEVMKSVNVIARVNSGEGYDLMVIGYDEKYADELNQHYKGSIDTAKSILDDIGNLQNVDLSGKFQKRNDIVFFPFVDGEIIAINTAFINCKNLEIMPQIIYTSQCGSFSQTWHGCNGLRTMPQDMDTSSASDFYSTWNECFQVRNMPNILNTDNVTSLFYSWRYCMQLVKITLTSVAKVTNWNSTFYLCYDLVTLKFTEWKQGDISLTQSSNLSSESIHYIIQNAVDKEDGATEGRKLSLNATAKTNWQNSEYYTEDLAVLSTKGITIA